jgi:hypothetical protein
MLAPRAQQAKRIAARRFRTQAAAPTFSAMLSSVIIPAGVLFNFK